MVKVDSLPDDVGDQAQLRLLFHHLLENALKFCPNDVEPLVHVKSVADEDLFTFTVEDNGAGIDDKLRERVFEMFYRADPSSPQSDKTGDGDAFTQCEKINEADLAPAVVRFVGMITPLQPAF